MRVVRRILARLLDVLLFVLLVLLAVIVLGGGGTVTVGERVVGFQNTRSPAVIFLLLLLLRRLIGGAEEFRRSDPVRLLTSIGSRIRQIACDPPGRASKLVWALALLQAALMTVITIRRHECFASHAFDLAIYDQLLWNAAHGRGLWSSILGHHYFGEHFSPILYGLVPLYRLASDVRVLLALQSVALAAGVIAVARLARRALQSEAAGLGFALLYSLYVPMRNANLYDFHPVALATPFLLFACDALESRRFALCALLSLLALSCKETVAFVVAAFGLWIAFRHGRRAMGGALAILGVITIVAATQWIVPHFRGSAFPFTSRYSYLGASAGEILRHLLTQPLLVLGHLADAKKLQYFFEVFAPLGFLSFLTPAVVLTMPTFLQNLLSDYPGQYSVAFQYTAELTPFVFYSATLGCAKLLKDRPASRSRVVALLAAGTLVFLGNSHAYQLRKFRPMLEHRWKAAQLAAIPPDAAVSAQDSLAPHLSQRREVTQFPEVAGARFVCLDPLAKTWPISAAEYLATVSRLRASGDYAVVVDTPSLVVLELRRELPPHE